MPCYIIHLHAFIITYTETFPTGNSKNGWHFSPAVTTGELNCVRNEVTYFYLKLPFLQQILPLILVGLKTERTSRQEAVRLTPRPYMFH